MVTVRGRVMTLRQVGDADGMLQEVVVVVEEGWWWCRPGDDVLAARGRVMSLYYDCLAGWCC